MKLTSPAFESNQPIPSKYTCEGLNCNPELHIHGVPQKAKSLTLIVDDSDVPKYIRPDGLWVHWVVFNLPANTQVIKENSTPKGIFGKTTSGMIGYDGPCPPDREHRYFFKLFALDCELTLDSGSSMEQILKAMEGHILAETELMGTYVKHHMGES